MSQDGVRHDKQVRLALTEEKIPGDSQQQMAGVVSMASGGLPFTCVRQASRPPSPSLPSSGFPASVFSVCEEGECELVIV